jgi:uncharacterized lipoprotein YddW (UPF0748 family)
VFAHSILSFFSKPGPLLFICLIQGLSSPLRAQEFRGLWVDAFNPGLKSSAEISRLVQEARAGHFNALIVQVRKRGDAYYQSSHEPKASDIPVNFDPLADLIAQAHDTSAGPRLEVHAWIVTYPIWNQRDTAPKQPAHPFNLKPHWLTRDFSGAMWDGGNYGLDPGHPEVQLHTFKIALDLLTRYPIDGLHLDYVRYAGNTWGYNPVSVARFNRLHGKTGAPAPTDADWSQFRRDQITALLRKIYLTAAEARPRAKISAATIAWAPGISATAQWPGTAAYNHVFQDWRGWMEEGILDLNFPMFYFQQRTHSRDYLNWIQFAKDHSYSRGLVIGTGNYLNSVSNSIVQIRNSRTRTPSGHQALGISVYSYHQSSADNLGFSRFSQALTRPSPLDLNPAPLFREPVPVPLLPWKATATTGHLKGYVAGGSSHLFALDGASLTLQGPLSRKLSTDATGFFGATDLPPGRYTVHASFPELESASAEIIIRPGGVSTRHFELRPDPGPLFFTAVNLKPGRRNVEITWNTREPAGGFVEYGLTPAYGKTSPAVRAPRSQQQILVKGLKRNTEYFVRITAQSGARLLHSEPQQFRTSK